MRNKLLLSALAMCGMSCGLTELGESPHSNADGVWTGPFSSSTSAVYVTAFEYPDGYDWRSDADKGVVKCSLVVFADKVPVLKIPVGDAYEVSSDPLRHRMIDGHLYTDYSDSSGTVIKKDGKELFRFLHQEEIACMAVSGSRVHTLGIRPAGGFCYRIDGEIVLERSSGKVFRHMVMDRGKACFCFSQPVMEAGGVKERYYSVVGGKTSRVVPDTLVTDVSDMIFDGGQVCILASTRDAFLIEGESIVSVFRDRERKDIFRSVMAGMLTCSFSDQDCLTVTGMYSTPASPMNQYLWTRHDGSVYLGYGRSLSALCINEQGICYAVNAEDGAAGVIAIDDHMMLMPEDYAVIGHDAMDFTDSISICLGLSSRKGGRPILWKSDGGTDTLDINGYVTTVSSGFLR